jgi:hypothetical protein
MPPISSGAGVVQSGIVISRHDATLRHVEYPQFWRYKCADGGKSG